MFTDRLSRLAALCIACCAALVTWTAAPLCAQAGNASPQLLDSLASGVVRNNRAIGVVAAVVKGRDTLLMKSYGKADVEWDVPMPIDAMFEIGSVSKQFTAAAILQLRDEGKLTLDDDLAKWLPNLDMGGRKIPLRNLLTHTSGVFRFSEEDAFERNMFMPTTSRDAALPLIKLAPFQYPTGEAQSYSNSGFYLLGLVVEKASGMKYEDYMAKRIFEPLGMTRSMFCNSLQNVPRRAHGYGFVNGVINRAPMVSYTWVFAPGAICSTAGDLVTWMQALHGGKVLTPQSYADMTTPMKLADGTPTQYGMGIKVSEDVRGLRSIGHGGTAPGFRADVQWYPESKLAVVALYNTSAPNLNAAELTTRLARAVLPWPRKGELAFFTGDATPFVGTYVMHMGGNMPNATVEVTMTPTGLAFAANGSRAQPIPWMGGSTFYTGENTRVTFKRANGDSGPATELHRDDPGNHAILRRK